MVKREKRLKLDSFEDKRNSSFERKENFWGKIEFLREKRKIESNLSLYEKFNEFKN